MKRREGEKGKNKSRRKEERKKWKKEGERTQTDRIKA